MSKKIWALAILALGFTSCEDDGELDDYKSVNPLLGKWSIVQQGSLLNGTINYTDVEVAEGCEADYIAFAETTFELHDFEDDGSGGCADFDLAGNYWVELGNIYLESETESSTLDIISLDLSTLQVVYTDVDSGELVFVKFQKN